MDEEGSLVGLERQIAESRGTFQELNYFKRKFMLFIVIIYIESRKMSKRGRNAS